MMTLSDLRASLHAPLAASLLAQEADAARLVTSALEAITARAPDALEMARTLLLHPLGRLGLAARLDHERGVFGAARLAADSPPKKKKR